MISRDFASRVELYPEDFTLAWADERAQGRDVDDRELSEAIYVKALAEELGEPQGTFYDLEERNNGEVFLGDPNQVSGNGNIPFRPYFALHDMRLAGGLERESEYLRVHEIRVHFGAMKYSEVGRYQQVGNNIVARRSDGHLVMAPDLPVVRERLEAANFQPYEPDEFNEDWNGFTHSAPKPGEVPLERKGYGDSSGHRVSADWRRAAKYWRQEQEKWDAEHQQQAAVAGAATALMVDSQRGVAIAGDLSDRTQLMPKGPTTAMFDMQRPHVNAGADQTRAFSLADRADANGQTPETTVGAFEAASTIGRLLEGAAREINAALRPALRGEPMPQLGETHAKLIDAVLSIIADREPQHENDFEPQAASDALEVFRASQQRYEQ